MRAKTSLLLIAQCVLFEVGCSNQSPRAATPVSTTPTIEITPTSATVSTGGSQQFSAVVKGVANSAVLWAVLESDGGLVTSNGRYVAPATPGVFHVVATSASDSLLAATAAVTVVSTSEISVLIEPAAAAVQTGGTYQFSATVTGGASTGVTWSVQEGNAGGRITGTGLYTAPSSEGTYHVVATSVDDDTKSATATVTVTSTPPAVFVTISPMTASVQAGATQQFDAAVTGTANTKVIWSVQEGNSGGRVSLAGLYTAPSTAGTFHVVATSVADDTKSAAATVTVTATPPAVSVTISPEEASVQVGATQQFDALVTGSANTEVAWSVQEGNAGGSVSSAGLYTAPPTAGTYHVVATSVADSNKSAIATVTVTATLVVSVAISPTTANLQSGAQKQFSVTVTGSTNTQVTWSVQEGSTGGSVSWNGMYTAPSTAGTYHVVATSVADATKNAAAAITVTMPLVSVTISPTNAVVAPGSVYKFTATVSNAANTAVTWAVVEPGGGAIDASGNYTAPSTPGLYHVKATSVADTKKSATAIAVSCSSGALCTPASSCHMGSISCSSTTGSSCTDSSTYAPNGTICGTNQVCNSGVCASCTAGQTCTSPDPCALGTTSCTTGTTQCVPGGPNPAKPNGASCTPTPVASGGGSCQSGTCTCPAGSAYYQGDCQACPAFIDTKVRVNADPTRGQDNACCGTADAPGFGGPCLTITQAYKNVRGSNWAIGVKGDVANNASGQERYPIRIGNGVTLDLNTCNNYAPVYLKGAAGKNVLQIDVDATVVTVLGGAFGIDSGGTAGGAVDAIYVGTTATGQASRLAMNSYWNTYAIRASGVQNVIHIDGGTVDFAYILESRDITNAIILCKSDSRPAAASTLTHFQGGGLEGSGLSGKYGLFAGQGCVASHVNAQFGASGAACPSPKPLQYGVWLEGNAQFSGAPSVNCASGDGLSLRGNPGLAVNNPEAVLISDSSFKHCGCAGVYVEAGKATIQGADIRNNHFGVWLHNSDSSTGPTSAPVVLNGQTTSGFNRNHFVCNGSAEPGQCSSGAYATKGFSIFNQSGYTIDASNNFWGDSPVSKCTCDYQLQNCSCSGSAYGETTPPDGLSIENCPFNQTTTNTPAVIVTGFAVDPNLDCN